jgi:acid phosphatase type 7
VIAAAGDVACAPDHPSYNEGLGIERQCHQRQVSDMLLKMDLWSVLVPGDIQYDLGQYDKFIASFDPTWGRLRNLLRPVPGNHEYGTDGAAGYFDYFNGIGQFDGVAGRRDQGYYSFNLGQWHIVALNSECADSVDRGAPSCAAGSPQEQWLRADLAAHPRRCTLAFWHHPLVSSGIEGVNAAVQPLWQALYDGGADVLLVGHDHAYERFAPQDANLVGDPARGVRQFLVGTGGRSLQRPVTVQNNTEIRDGDNFGVLQMTLRPDRYEWNFAPEKPGGFTDTGSTACH